MKKVLSFLFVLFFVSVNAYAQSDNKSGGFYRLGVGGANFQSSSGQSEKSGNLHFHEVAVTTHFTLGYEGNKFRTMVFFDPAIVDGVRGTSIISVGAKSEVGVPRVNWLKVGGGVAYSSNYAKLSDDVEIYERDGKDTLLSPFGSITFLSKEEEGIRFFADIRVGRSFGGDVLSFQNGKPIAENYISISVGMHFGFPNKNR